MNAQILKMRQLSLDPDELQPTLAVPVSGGCVTSSATLVVVAVVAAVVVGLPSGSTVSSLQVRVYPATLAQVCLFLFATYYHLALLSQILQPTFRTFKSVGESD